MSYKYVNPTIMLKEEMNIPEKPSEKEYESIGYVKKENVFFAFIDVLGFKNFFDNTIYPNQENDSKVDIKNRSIDKYEKVFSYYFELMNAWNFYNKNQDECYAGQTSDSLYFYTTRTDILFGFLKIFAHFSVYAITENVFFRGGIARGNLFCKDKYQFFGESVIKAYLMESIIAKNPLIYIDDSTYKELKKESKSIDRIVKSDQFRHYLSPFVGLEKEFNFDDDILETFTINVVNKEEVYNKILHNKEKSEYEESIYKKYVHLLKEYNKFDEEEKQG